MKKIIYNKITKLLVMLLTLFCGGLLISSLITIIDKHADYSGHTDAIFSDNAYMSNYIRQDLAETVGITLNSVVMCYFNGGMEEVENDFYYDNDQNGQRYNVIIADENNIYSSFPDVDITGVKDTLSYVENDINSQYVTKLGNSQIWLQADTGRVYIWYYTEWLEVPVEEYLSADALQGLGAVNNKLAVKVCLTPEYAEGDFIWGDVENRRYDLYDHISWELEAKVSAYVIDVVVFAGAFIALSVIGIFICGRTPEGLKSLNCIERAGTEIYIGIIGAGFLGMFGLLNILMETDGRYYVYYVYDKSISSVLENIHMGVLAAAVGIVAVCYIAAGMIVKKLKNRRFIKDFYIVKIICWMKKILTKVLVKLCRAVKGCCKAIYSRTIYGKMPELKKLYVKKIASDIFVGIIIIIVICAIVILDGDMWTLSYFMYMLVWILIVLYFRRSVKEYRYLREYNRVTKAVSIIAGEEYSEMVVAEDEKNDTIVKLANMSTSFKESVNKQVESEKMQIELVANVSRDLKGPLNSIVSYVDLLKNEEMSDVAKDYVMVLVDKSSRLNDIVSDVFDLAKATSGEDVDVEQLDGVVLLNQVLADMSDRIEETGKDLRISIGTDSAYIRANGQKLYRVFQNVIDNALKYSMPGTRIYLNAEKLDGQFYVTIKNISEYEMDFTEEEIMSRFTRGDKARHSEGNGLGLSIAKSFTELCGGNFEVKLDDDVFTVIICLR